MFGLGNLIRPTLRLAKWGPAHRWESGRSYLREASPEILLLWRSVVGSKLDCVAVFEDKLPATRMSQAGIEFLGCHMALVQVRPPTRTLASETLHNQHANWWRQPQFKTITLFKNEFHSTSLKIRNCLKTSFSMMTWQQQNYNFLSSTSSYYKGQTCHKKRRNKKWKCSYMSQWYRSSSFEVSLSSSVKIYYYIP